MDDFGSQGISDADFADVMSRAVPEGQIPTPVETSPSAPDPTPSTQPSVPVSEPTPPIVAAQPDGVQAATSAAPVDPSQSSQTDPTPPQEQTPGGQPQWNDPQNPYYAQANQMAGVMQAAQMYAAQQQQLADQQNFAREQAAAAELMRRMPDLDPDEQQIALQSVMGWQAKQYQGQLAKTNAKLESAAAIITYDFLDKTYGLDPQQSATLRTIHNAEMAEMYARSQYEARTQYEQRLAHEKAQFSQAQLQGRAQDRLASGVDTVGGGGGAPASMASATNIDEFWAALDQATARR